MDKTTWGLFAALGAAAVVTPAAASAPASDRILAPTSIAELLEPVADPVATLDALSEPQLEAVEASDGDMTAMDHHHHHHHHGFFRHHHHHHFFLLPRLHHHHHHHHHHYRRD